ncbi:MAG TPA: cytochrome c-type biogenesis protein CcmH [Candidatus Eisenbacteria bacterium]|nr:cytochrome c-type biogenesis protein CcmH [Candidatus Eisenbacteria bacterium]
MKLTVLMTIAGIVLLGAAHDAEAQALTPAQMESYHRLTNQLIAPCCWREPIAIHRSPEAQQMSEETASLLANGRTEDQIRAMYVARYGARILADPPGQDWYWLNLIPFALLITLMLAAAVRLRWLVSGTPPVSRAASPEFLAQVRTETQHDW